MKKAAQAAEEAMHSVCEAMSRIYCLEDQLNASSSNENTESQKKNSLWGILG